MKRISIILALYIGYGIITSNLFAENTDKLTARYANKENVLVGAVFTVDDKCTFTLLTSEGDLAQLTSSKWELYGYVSTTEQRKIFEKDLGTSSSFEFSIDTTLMSPGLFKNLKTYKLINDSSNYFFANLTLKATTINNEIINRVFPIKLNLLPSTPKIYINQLKNNPYISSFTIHYTSARAERYYRFRDYFDRASISDVDYDVIDNTNYVCEFFNEQYDESTYSNYGVIYDLFQVGCKNSFGLVKSDILSIDQNLIQKLKDNATHVEFPKAPAQEDLYFFPNPASDELHIGGKNIEKIQSISFVSPNGRFVKHVEGNSRIINISDLPKGIYVPIINFTKSNIRICSKKIIKQ